MAIEMQVNNICERARVGRKLRPQADLSHQSLRDVHKNSHIPLLGKKPMVNANEASGLVLTAGGARGAYQAGVLKRLGEIPRLKGKPSPFSIITGASAGAINSVAV